MSSVSMLRCHTEKCGFKLDRVFVMRRSRGVKKIRARPSSAALRRRVLLVHTAFPGWEKNVLWFILPPPIFPYWGIGRLQGFSSLSSCPQVWHVLLTSASRSRRQLFLGRPLFLFPWGFHERDCLVILEASLQRVCPMVV